MEEKEDKTYTVLVDNDHEDGVGESWSYEQAMTHIKRCAFDAHNIKYELKEHIVELQPTEPESKPKRTRENSTNSSE